MKKEQSFLVVVFLLLFSLFITCINVTSTSITQTPPAVKDNAPTVVTLEEDSPNYYLDLYTIYEDTGGNINFSIWDGSSWRLTFQNSFIIIVIKSNDTLELNPEPDRSGIATINLNATSSDNLSTHYNLTVKVNPANDPPEIEMIDNVKVIGNNTVKLFAYQDDWFNISVKAGDIDGDNLVYIDNATIFDIDYQTGSISIKLKNEHVGEHHITITVSDVNGTNGETRAFILFTVLNINDPPVAKITEPEDGSRFYSYDDTVFKGEGYDPDFPHGDKLAYRWNSDIDGIIGESNEIEVYFLSRGRHKITFTVTDTGGLESKDIIFINVTSKYPTYSDILLSAENESLLIKQNEKAVGKFTAENDGWQTENVTFKVKISKGFNGKAELEYDYLIIEGMEQITMNITVSVTSDTKIGVYLLEITTEPSAVFDEDYPYDGYYDSLTIAVYVVCNTTDVSNFAEIPTYQIGYNWKYDMNLKEDWENRTTGKGNIDIEIIDEAKVKVDDVEYDVYEADMNSDLEISYGNYYEPSMEMEIEIDGNYYLNKPELAEVKSYVECSAKDKSYADDEIVIKIKSIYKPPMDKYDFPIYPGETWNKTVTLTEESEFEYSIYGGGFDTEYYEEKLTRSFVCLGTETVTTKAGSFTSYLITEYERTVEGEDYYGPGLFFDYLLTDDYSIEYYSPDVNGTVKQISYSKVYNDNDIFYEEYDWRETSVMELTSYSLKPGTPDSNNGKDTQRDIDKDGMADEWEDNYDVEEPDEDDDDDGFTNFEEFLEGTDPTDYFDTPDEPIDEDDDGLPDSWEKFHGLDPTDPTDALSDPDDDGFSSYTEYDKHTSPDDPYDYPTSDSSDDDAAGAFGLGKMGGVDLAFIYAVITAIVLFVLIFFGIIIHRRRKGNLGYHQSTYKDEPRVAGPEGVKYSSTPLPQPIQGVRPAQYPPQPVYQPTPVPQQPPQPYPRQQPYYPPPPPPPQQYYQRR